MLTEILFFQAANLLKRTEGLVTLVVSNPGKKEQALIQNNTDSKGKPTILKHGPPSRPTTPVPG